MSDMYGASMSMMHAAPGAYSLGLAMRDDGTIIDTIEGMVAPKAGIGPGMKVIGVNGRRYSNDVLREALKTAKANNTLIELLVENDEYYKTYKLDYHGGEQYPHLVRDESKPDLLSDILRAK
jgi:predicted metalloprotease with PDZ domain